MIGLDGYYDQQLADYQAEEDEAAKIADEVQDEIERICKEEAETYCESSAMKPLMAEFMAAGKGNDKEAFHEAAAGIYDALINEIEFWAAINVGNRMDNHERI